MKVKIEIEVGNEAMRTWEDVADAIESRIAVHVDIARQTYTSTEVAPSEYLPKMNLRDLNGNVVGKIEVLP